jgi:hypothetical protein
MNVTKEQSAQSWKRTIELFEQMLLEVNSAYLGPMLDLVKRLARNPLANHFLASQSHEILGIAKVSFVLPDAPHVCVTYVKETTCFDCSLLTGPHGSTVVAKYEGVDAIEVEEVVIGLMRQLDSICNSTKESS